MRKPGAGAVTFKSPSSPPRSAHFDTRAIWAIALPAMVTNVATALIGLGDMWIVGRLGDASAQGAVDVGARNIADRLV